MLYCATVDGVDVATERLAKLLRRAGMDSFAVFLLEAGGPLVPLAAQAVFILEPFFGKQRSVVGDLARILDDPVEVETLVECLSREEAC
jgi:hypothetical protein